MAHGFKQEFSDVKPSEIVVDAENRRRALHWQCMGTPPLQQDPKPLKLRVMILLLGELAYEFAVDVSLRATNPVMKMSDEQYDAQLLA